MNKGLIALNGILGVAVIILFWLHFSTEETTVQNKPSKTNDSIVIDSNPNDSLNQYLVLDSNIAAKPIKIAYVNSDSLDKNLKMLKDVETEIANKEQELSQKIQNEQSKYERSFQSKISNFEQQRKDYTIKAPTMTDAQLQQKQKELQQMQQELGGLEQKYQMELMEFQQRLDQEYRGLKAQKMAEYYKKVQGFCSTIANRLGFDFILIYRDGGTILHANTSFDISKYVIDAINKEYDENNPIKNPTTENANS